MNLSDNSLVADKLQLHVIHKLTCGIEYMPTDDRRWHCVLWR